MDGARGTVLMFPGRCEYVEKYGRSAAEFNQRGYASLAVDWRGQGLADRLINDPDIGHVGRFHDYQRDVRAVLADPDVQALPRPWLLLGHSMGGAIALRAILDGVPVDAAAFSAPMWGIRIEPKMRPLSMVLPKLAALAGMGARQAPTTNGADFLLNAPFEDNGLTTDPDMWAYLKRQLQAEPRYRLGGPSLTWLGEALSEMRALLSAEKPEIPALVGLGALEKIVDADAIVRLVDTWPSARLIRFDGAEHELLMERPEVRNELIDQALALLPQ
ncbi:MAG: alpha/beta hydrolase [Pseudomonadota bacterium]